MVITSTEIEALFLSPATPRKLKELWETCQRFGAGQTFQGKEDIFSVRFDASSSGKDLNFHLKNWKEMSEKAAEDRCHGGEEYLTTISKLGEGDYRFGSVQNERIYGTVVTDFQKKSIVAFCFILRQPLHASTATLQDINTLFESPSTPIALQTLWETCKVTQGKEGFHQIDCGDTPMLAWNLWDIYEVRLMEIKKRYGVEYCHGDEEFMASLRTVEKIRLGGVVGKRITGLLAAHPTEPFIVGFFYFDRLGLNLELENLTH